MAEPTAAALIERAARRLRRARVHFGHGTDNARDDGAFLVLHALGLPPDADREQLALPLTAAQVARAMDLVEQRLARRCPAAYLTGRMWFAGHEFAVDERVLVPRSPLAELIERRFAPWLDGARVARVLDIGTGSGCIAIATALALPSALVDATDVSADALAVAADNRRRHGLEARVELHLSDLFPPAPTRYDLILSNPPYVPAARLAELPAEFHAEPATALVAGSDGLACVSRILSAAADWLAPHGWLVVEVGEIAPQVEARYPHLPFTWIEFERGGEGVFALPAHALRAGS